MTTLFQRASIAFALGVTAFAVASPAEAQRYGGGYHGRDNGGTAVIAGIAGLAIGAAVASDHDRGRYYDRGYDQPVIYQNPDYYEVGPAYGGYYEDRGYYQERGYYRDRDRYRGGRGGYDRWHGGRGYRDDHRR
jgi:hypothetical protein